MRSLEYGIACALACAAPFLTNSNGAWAPAAAAQQAGAKPAAKPTSKKKPAPKDAPPTLPEAVDRALDWLAAHQSADGSWDCDGFAKNCGKLGANVCSGAGGPNQDVGVTALALLAFLRARGAQLGENHELALAKGLEWLKGQQQKDGGFGPRIGQAWMYCHACATLAMVEACAVPERAELREFAEGGLALVLRAQNPYSGWRYSEPPDGDSDTSVTGWMVSVLKSARVAKIEYEKDVLENALTFVELVTDADGRTGYTEAGQTSSRMPEVIQRFPADNCQALTSIGLTVRLAAGRTVASDPMLSKGADLVVNHLPEWNTENGSIDFYYWYCATQALSALGGPRRERWEKALKSVLLEHQRSVASEDAFGSWDTVDPWSTVGGRVYATALNCIALESCASEPSSKPPSKH